MSQQTINVAGSEVELELLEGEQVTSAVIIVNTQMINEEGEVAHGLQWAANENDDTVLEGLVSRAFRDMKRYIDENGERS